MSENPQATTRSATAADISAVMELERSVKTAAHWGRDQYEAIFAPQPRRIMILVYEADLLRGFLVASSAFAEWEIENIVVAEASRRQGFGRMLMADFLGRIGAEGAEAVFLEVRESSGPARAFYEKSGFVEAGRRTGYFSDPKEDAILYRLCFPPV